MAYADTSFPSFLGPIKARLAAAKADLREYRRKRAVYLRTLNELQAYRPHELQDLRIGSSDIDMLARKQAGW